MTYDAHLRARARAREGERARGRGGARGWWVSSPPPLSCLFWVCFTNILGVSFPLSYISFHSFIFRVCFQTFELTLLLPPFHLLTFALFFISTSSIFTENRKIENNFAWFLSISASSKIQRKHGNSKLMARRPAFLVLSCSRLSVRFLFLSLSFCSPLGNHFSEAIRRRR